MADITLISGADPDDTRATNGSYITILNSVTNADGTPAATTLTCESGLFTPASDFPMPFTAGEQKTVHIGTITAGGKQYSYNDPSTPLRGTRSGRINPG